MGMTKIIAYSNTIVIALHKIHDCEEICSFHITPPLFCFHIGCNN
jgi:hypothetical protein